jgi:hypothetical protein
VQRRRPRSPLAPSSFAALRCPGHAKNC